jgi:hypothetical protein
MGYDSASEVSWGQRPRDGRVGKAERRFLRHRLILFGMMTLVVLTLGLLFYQKAIDEIGFPVTLKGPGVDRPMVTACMTRWMRAQCLNEICNDCMTKEVDGCIH